MAVLSMLYNRTIAEHFLVNRDTDDRERDAKYAH